MFRALLLALLLAQPAMASDDRLSSREASSIRCEEKSVTGEQGYDDCMLEKEAGMAGLVDTIGAMMPGLADTCRRQFPKSGFDQADCMRAALDTLKHAAEALDTPGEGD